MDNNKNIDQDTVNESMNERHKEKNEGGKNRYFSLCRLLSAALNK